MIIILILILIFIFNRFQTISISIPPTPLSCKFLCLQILKLQIGMVGEQKSHQRPRRFPNGMSLLKVGK